MRGAYGMPKCAVPSKVSAPAVSAENPPKGVSLVIRWPMVDDAPSAHHGAAPSEPMVHHDHGGSDDAQGRAGLPKDKPAEPTQWTPKHLAYIRSQAEAGKFVLVGPMREENRLRGSAIIKADSLEEAQRIASGDPLVQSGHLVVEVHPILLEDLSRI